MEERPLLDAGRTLTSGMTMHIDNRRTSLDHLLAHDLCAEEGTGQPPASRGVLAPTGVARRSLLAGLGVASCAAFASSLLLPASARAHGNGHGNGNGHGHGHGNGHGHGHDDDCDDDSKEDVVWGLMGAFETLDADEIGSWLHADVLYQNTGLPDILGRQAVKQFIPQFAMAFESLTNEVVNMVSHGRLICTERIEHYVVAQGSPIGIPGAELTMRVAGWHEVKHGKVIRWSDFWDTRTFSDTLGIPLPGA